MNAAIVAPVSLVGSCGVPAGQLARLDGVRCRAASTSSGVACSEPVDGAEHQLPLRG